MGHLKQQSKPYNRGISALGTNLKLTAKTFAAAVCILLLPTPPLALPSSWQGGCCNASSESSAVQANRPLQKHDNTLAPNAPGPSSIEGTPSPLRWFCQCVSSFLGLDRCCGPGCRYIPCSGQTCDLALCVTLDCHGNHRASHLVLLGTEHDRLSVPTCQVAFLRISWNITAAPVCLVA